MTLWTLINHVNIGSANGLLPDGTITWMCWTNDGLASLGSSGINLKAIVLEMLMKVIAKNAFEILYKKNPTFPWEQWVNPA